MRELLFQSWNIQGRKNITGYTRFEKLLPYFDKFSANIIALQEATSPQQIKNSLPGYEIVIPESNGRKANPNDNIILSRLPVLGFEELAFPQNNSSDQLENCTVAEINSGAQTIKIYNCHFGIFGVGIVTRINQLRYVLSHAASHSGPVIVCGDMNTTIPELGWNRKIISLWHQEPLREMWVNGRFVNYDERELFNRTVNYYGFKEALDLYTPTWSPFKSNRWEPFKLKLDWFLVRGPEIVDATLGDYASDHKPIIVRCRI